MNHGFEGLQVPALCGAAGAFCPRRAFVVHCVIILRGERGGPVGRGQSYRCCTVAAGTSSVSLSWVLLACFGSGSEGRSASVVIWQDTGRRLPLCDLLGRPFLHQHQLLVFVYVCVCVWVCQRQADEVIDCVSADRGKPVRTLYSLQGQFHCAV